MIAYLCYYISKYINICLYDRTIRVVYCSISVLLYYCLVLLFYNSIALEFYYFLSIVFRYYIIACHIMVMYSFNMLIILDSRLY